MYVGYANPPIAFVSADAFNVIKETLHTPLQRKLLLLLCVQNLLITYNGWSDSLSNPASALANDIRVQYKSPNVLEIDFPFHEK